MARKIGVGGQEISTDTGGSFAPLPAGRYEATIFSVKEGEYKSEKNRGLPNLNVQYRISEGQKGANRRLFDLVPLSPNWKNGKDAFRFWQFGAAVNGTTEKAFREKAKEAAAKKTGSVTLPDDADLLGKAVTLVLGIEDDDYNFDKAHKVWEAADDPELPEPVIADYQRNKISNVLVAGSGDQAGGSEKSAEISSAVTLEEFQL